MGINAVYTPYNTMKGLATAFLAGTSVRTGRQSQIRGGNSQTLTTTRKRKRQPQRLSLKKAIINTFPAKHYTAEASVANTHNVILSMCPTQGITQGDGNTNRDGDRIFLEALKIKGQMQSATTAGCYSHRIIVGWSGEEYTTANIANSFVAGLTAAEIFLPSTTTNWMPGALINPKAFTVLLDETYDINSQVTATQDGVSFAHTIPLKTDFSYQATASVQGKTRNLFVIVTGAVANGAGGTSIGNHICSVDLIFKNA